MIDSEYFWIGSALAFFIGLIIGLNIEIEWPDDGDREDHLF